jgi:hypothetical protein
MKKSHVKIDTFSSQKKRNEKLEKLTIQIAKVLAVWEEILACSECHYCYTAATEVTGTNPVAYLRHNMKPVHSVGIYTLINVKGKVPVLNYLSTVPWKHMGEWRYSSISLDLGTRRKYVVSFMPSAVFPPRKEDRRLGGLQSRSRCFGEEK